MSTEHSAQRLVVFSHPNHELAVYGLVSRLRPHMLFLTDGGGESRVEATRAGLQALGLLGRASFLGHPEGELYRALLEQDFDFLERLVTAIREQVRATSASEVFCDAVEFYNPVHDLTLPLVRAALGRTSNTAVYEIALIHQRLAPTESYRVQRFAPDAGPEPQRLRLTQSEIEAKARAREEIYTDLKEQLGPVITDLPAEHLAVEEWREAASPMREPEGEEVLRYEWRGELLRDQGEVEGVIYRREHYLPMVEWAMGSTASRGSG
jgi:hypothetical protein